MTEFGTDMLKVNGGEPPNSAANAASFRGS